MKKIIILVTTLLLTPLLQAKKPNIVLIMADDLGYEGISANGGTSYQTPVLDSLAKTGMRFEHCYSQPLCTPSRVQIMTGIYNVRNYVGFARLDRKQTTFAHLLKKAGYATCIAGKWQLGRDKDSPPALRLRSVLPVAAHPRWSLHEGRHQIRPPLRQSVV